MNYEVPACVNVKLSCPMGGYPLGRNVTWKRYEKIIKPLIFNASGDFNDTIRIEKGKKNFKIF